MAMPTPGFTCYDHAAIIDHLHAHGWAVVKAAIPTALASGLANDVRRLLGDRPGDPYHTSFIDVSPAAQALLAHDPFLEIHRALNGGDITVNRSAAILRRPGSSGSAWHSDFDYRDTPPTTVDGVLNRGEWLNGAWFYLTGCRPDHGGLAVIPGSQRSDWQPPSGYRFAPDRRGLLHDDGSPAAMDMPGARALITDPEDLILFSARTWHGAFPLHGTTERLSCGITFRPRAATIVAPWPLPQTARDMIQRAPPALAPMLTGYVGLELGWHA